MKKHMLESDLYLFSSTLKGESEFLKNKKVLVIGGSGFFGTWVVHALHYLNTKENTQIKIFVLSRNANKAQAKLPFLPSERFIEADVQHLAGLKITFDYIFHFGTPASAELIRDHPLEMLNNIFEGTKRVLEVARDSGASVLLASSGAIYGSNPGCQVTEDQTSRPSVLRSDSAYGIGKMNLELLATIFQQKYNVDVKVARCFAFVGPYLPIDAHFAIGNFISNVLHSRKIQIKGNGKALRSYLYGADLAVWLIKIMIHGNPAHPYNVGSEHVVSIGELAERIVKLAEHKPGLEILGTSTGRTTSGYAPSTSRAQTELGLKEYTSLDQAILRTLKWWRTDSIINNINDKKAKSKAVAV